MTTERPHVVYRCYDADDRLIYIGCTNDVNARLALHRCSWDNPASAAINLRMVRHTVTEYPSKSSARKAEREAIYNEAPILNHFHQKVMRTPAQRRTDITAYVNAGFEVDHEFRAAFAAALARLAPTAGIAS